MVGSPHCTSSRVGHEDGGAHVIDERRGPDLASGSQADRDTRASASDELPSIVGWLDRLLGDVLSDELDWDQLAQPSSDRATGWQPGRDNETEMKDSQTGVSSTGWEEKKRGQHTPLDGILRAKVAMTADAVDKLVFWQTNEITPAEPPPDRAEWIKVIRDTVRHRVRVVLTTDGRGHWRVSVAEELRVNVGAGPWPTDPIDHQAAVAEALRRAGKPIRD
jgi:hypothetical protein